MQNTSHLLMIEPVNFGYNTETAVNNAFQKNLEGDIQQKAMEEFNAFVDLLKKNKIDVTVIKDTVEPFTPDSIFPNNWISFHEDGTVFLYPMFAPNRRLERKEHVLELIREKFIINKVTDLSYYETENGFLEGTGSMVFDRINRIAYACISPRTDKPLFDQFCTDIGFLPVSFSAKDASGVDIYHTNVLMCVADKYAVICTEAIQNDAEREYVLAFLQKTNKEIITISFDQLDHFAGNMLQVMNENNEPLLIMSTQARNSLTAAQVSSLEKYNAILHSSLDTIETAGGGSARCMMAEVFLEMI